MIDAALRDYRFSLWRMFLAVTAIAIVLAGYAWFDERYMEPRRRSQSIREQLKSLALRRPAEMTPLQWESAVAWTGNLHANSLLAFETDGRTLRAFEGRLRAKLQERVNLATIHWIWKEYADLCPHGASYQRFHPQMMEEIEAGGGGWGLNIP